MKKQYFILSREDERARFSEPTGDYSPFELGAPLLDLDDETIRKIYYFRLHTYCKHIKNTPAGRVVTEFLPDVGWAGKYNTICCPAGHHFYEGRWFADSSFLDDYARFWFSPEGAPRLYSFWAADAVWALCAARGDFSLAEGLLDDLIANFRAWEADHLDESGLFHQIDDRDGMEYSIGGSGFRPTINSYMYGDAAAISKIAARLGRREDERVFAAKAAKLKELIDSTLWDGEAEFYKTVREDGAIADVREEVGYVPWYFNIPGPEKSVAWKFLFDEKHFKAPFGPTTAERCHPGFMQKFDHECLWNGPSWPFATSQTLTAMANLIDRGDGGEFVGRGDFFDLLSTYAGSHFLTENGVTVPFIDEDLDPFDGHWIAREELKARGVYDRGVDYNHSTFCDPVISGLCGVRPREDGTLSVLPMFREDQLLYLCLDGAPCLGRFVTVVWDRTGGRFGRGRGLSVLVDGETVGRSDRIERIDVRL
ncbi:MAG: hypothetical protein IJS78_02355 [Clostridia bacterium]|nr:hypothetical protein [Clostridia bacterium]